MIQTTRRRIWLQPYKYPNGWGPCHVIEVDRFAPDGLDVTVEGDGKDLEEYIAARKDIFSVGTPSPSGGR